MTRIYCVCAGLILLTLPVLAQRGNVGGTISLKKRLHINTLITTPGTIEIDWAAAYSLSSDGLFLPTAIKYTPMGRHDWWGRTEYSVAFNAFDGPASRFGQTMTVTGTCVLIDGTHLDIAIAPQVTAFLRDERGARLGATAIARLDVGRNSIGATLGWSGATNSSATNPAGTVDVGFGAGRRLAAGGALGHFSPHFNAGWERSTGVARIVSLAEGVEYQIVDAFAFDVSAQQVAAFAQRPDRQVIFSITANLGHPKLAGILRSPH